jgi:protease-4
MMNWLIDGIYGTLIDQIAQGRGVTPEKARSWIDLGMYSAEKAKAAGIIDEVEHRQQFQAMLKEKYGDEVVFDRKFGVEKPPTLDLSSPLGIFKLWGEMMGGGAAAKAADAKPAVGIVYVEGPIMVGSAQQGLFGGMGVAMSSDIRKALDDAASDDAIKAVVLRIDSPGGSAVASEIILDATKRVKARKPLIVSMGNVAGSGGYYVACGADTIFADSSTITGSIGVVVGKLVTTEMWNRVGVTWKPYQRGASAAILSSAASFSPPERERIQGWMNDVYDVFKGHVTAIRGTKLTKPIEEIAGGRVYTGRQALDLGLVDKLGTLDDAVAYAADQAKIADFDVRVVPEPKNFLEEIIKELSGGGEDEDAGRLLKLGAAPSLWELALPHLSGLDPARIAAVKEAMTQLQTLSNEGVILMAPPIVVGR